MQNSTNREFNNDLSLLEITWGLGDSHVKGLGPGGGGSPRKVGWGVQPTSQNPYPIYDQNLRYSLPYL